MKNLNSQHHGLSPFDLFGLFSGILGFLANIVTLSSLFMSASELHTNSNAVWVLSFFLIVYTPFVLSFYVRRLSARRFMNTYGGLSARSFLRIREAGMVVAGISGFPLWECFIVTVLVQLFHPFGTGIGMQNQMVNFITSALFLTFILAIPASLILGWLARVVYESLDPSFVITIKTTDEDIRRRTSSMT